MKIEADRAGAMMVEIGRWTLWFTFDRELAFWTYDGKLIADVVVGVG